MRITVLALLIIASHQVKAYNFNPISTFQRLCIHHTQNGPSEIFAIIPNGNYSCPTFSNANNGCMEFHLQGKPPTWVCPPTQSASSQHCWVEDKELRDE